MIRRLSEAIRFFEQSIAFKIE